MVMQTTGFKQEDMQLSLVQPEINAVSTHSKRSSLSHSEFKQTRKGQTNLLLTGTLSPVCWPQLVLLKMFTTALTEQCV